MPDSHDVSNSLMQSTALPQLFYIQVTIKTYSTLVQPQRKYGTIIKRPYDIRDAFDLINCRIFWQRLATNIPARRRIETHPREFHKFLMSNTTEGHMGILCKQSPMSYQMISTYKKGFMGLEYPMGSYKQEYPGSTPRIRHI